MALIAELLINDVHQWLTLLESFELRDEELHGSIQPIGCMVGTMRGQQYIFQLVEGMTLGQGFVIENIQGGAFDTLLRKRIYQRLLPDHGAASDIDHHGCRLHGCELRLSDHSTRLWSQGCGYDYVIAARDHLDAAIGTVHLLNQRVRRRAKAQHAV